MSTYNLKPKILVVDDHTDILQALKIRLQNAGYEVVVAQDCISGTMKAREEQPDIALLDINMPGGDGFKLAERIDMNSGKQVTKIFITASRDREFVKRAEFCGAVEYLEKPFTAEQLFDAIELAENRLDTHREYASYG